MGAYQGIHRADRCPGLFKVGTYLSISSAGRFIKRRYLKRGDKFFKGNPVSMDMMVFFNATLKLGEGYRRYPDITNFMPLKMPDNFRWFLLDKVDACICIKHEFHRTSPHVSGSQAVPSLS